MYFHVPTPTWNISACISALLMMCMHSESHAYMHIYKGVHRELSLQAFPLAFRQVVDVTLIFPIAACTVDDAAPCDTAAIIAPDSVSL